MKHDVPDSQAMESLGATLAASLAGGDVVFLIGGLGAGKTTLVRGMLQSLGHSDAVKSPTYTLVEPYHLGGHDIYHFDLYRIEDFEELELIGAREFFGPRSIALIEWPDRGEGFLESPSITISITINDGGSRTVAVDRANAT